ncbi:MAG: cell envelope integrity protein TolA, partial [Bdellovibrionales bacterium]
DGRATEITLIEKPEPKPKTKANLIVDQPEQKEDNQDIKKQADFLSQFTKRVKQQVQARMVGETVNATNKQARESHEKAGKRFAGNESKEQGETDTTKAREQEMTAVNSGQSAIQEVIPGVEGASYTALNTDQFTFYAFYNRTGTQVRNRWVGGLRNYVDLLTQRKQEELSARNRTTVLEVVLTPEGQVFRTVVQESCGDKGLDDVAIQAFRDAAPFPHPPREMVRSDGFIHYYAGFTVYFRPPSFGPAG